MARLQRSDRGARKPHMAIDIVEKYRPSDGCPPLRAHSSGTTAARDSWLRRFAKEVGSSEACTLAWEQVENKCDTSFLIDLLYLFTYRGEVRVDEDVRAYRVLRAKLKKLSRIYNKLDDELRQLTKDKRLSEAMSFVGSPVIRQINLLGQALWAAEKKSSLRGSYKTKAKDWYLYLLATEVKAATGSPKIIVIGELIGAADAAHDDDCDLSSFGNEVLKKRIERYMKRLARKGAKNPLVQSSSSEKDSDIPF